MLYKSVLVDLNFSEIAMAMRLWYRHENENSWWSNYWRCLH